MAKTHFYKLGKGKQVFSNPKMTLVNLRPGKIEGEVPKAVRVAAGSGHIVEITEEEYDKMMVAHSKQTLEKMEKGATAKKIKETPNSDFTAAMDKHKKVVEKAEGASSEKKEKKEKKKDKENKDKE